MFRFCIGVDLVIGGSVTSGNPVKFQFSFSLVLILSCCFQIIFPSLSPCGPMKFPETALT